MKIVSWHLSETQSTGLACQPIVVHFSEADVMCFKCWDIPKKFSMVEERKIDLLGITIVFEKLQYEWTMVKLTQ